MIYKVVIDANVWIKYARAKDINPLLSRFTTYNLLPVTNNYLLTEIHDALVDNNWMKENQADKIISFIKKITLFTTGQVIYRISPDPKDNYLFDLAIQNNCVFVISDDLDLVDFKLKPVPVHTSNWFLKKFSV